MYQSVLAFFLLATNLHSGQQASAATVPGPTSLADAGVLKEAPPNSLPYHAQLFVGGNDNKHLCHGALITDRHILTAASCLSQAKAPDVSVILGDAQSQGDEGSLPVESIVTHPVASNQTKASCGNDVAIVTLAQEVQRSEGVEPVEVAAKDFNSSQSGRVSGCATTSSPCQVLQYADVPILDDDACEHAWRDFDDDLEMCAGTIVPSGAGAACEGFEGSPLVVTMAGDTTGKRYLYGMVTSKSQCGSSNKLSRYANFEEMHAFIAQNTAMRPMPASAASPPPPPLTIEQGAANPV